MSKLPERSCVSNRQRPMVIASKDSIAIAAKPRLTRPEDNYFCHRSRRSGLIVREKQNYTIPSSPPALAAPEGTRVRQRKRQRQKESRSAAKSRWRDGQSGRAKNYVKLVESSANKRDFLIGPRYSSTHKNSSHCNKLYVFWRKALFLCVRAKQAPSKDIQFNMTLHTEYESDIHSRGKHFSLSSPLARRSDRRSLSIVSCLRTKLAARHFRSGCDGMEGNSQRPGTS